MTDKIAVIVPVYNVRRYLRRCVDSILGQTWRDFEAVLVDDCSTDGSSDVCDQCAGADPRIHVVHRGRNGGLSAARNDGIEWVLARTDCGWISFVDSDDWIEERFLGSMLSGARECGAGIAVCSFRRASGPEAASAPVGSVFRKLTPEGFVSACERMGNRGLFLQDIACAKLYGKQVFERLRFPENVRAHEDVYTTYKAVFGQNAVAFTEDELYCYFENPESITGSRWSAERIHTIRGHARQIEFFEKGGFDAALGIAVKQQLRRYAWVIDESRKAGLPGGLLAELEAGRGALFRKYCGRFGLPLTEFPQAWRQVRPFAAKFFYPALAIRLGPKETLARIAKKIAGRFDKLPSAGSVTRGKEHRK